MAKTTGEIIETPTEEMPYKARIMADGELVQERFFASRVECEIYIAEALRGLEETARKEGHLK